MLDINFVRQNKEQVKEACINKNLDSSIVDQLLQVDEERRSLQKEMDELRSQANNVADEIKKMVAEGNRPDAASVENGKAIKNKLKDLEPKDKEVNEKFFNLSSQSSLFCHTPNQPLANQIKSFHFASLILITLP
mgnify:CR=1 FL=1